ncbi:MAG: hypothetical protein COW88_00575 [Candidatus Lloydbacteria bacterium CG22_combo_CG10-13_8_21_14_all_47_15]|uniref:Uncharacterized protein n=1 Tax=Candidatus Lloydbacteria bacterium CG22_combo_CG10-13_8_21_14_all_47_15 TaxID=1974635 RepID=A0A2H0CVE3_9BACT|nr:MAG: hypothetical protein COW88_00575 [Candidatus Lloydbacteria bacterium CG22_combo_CG10-13_8_21_14_all_47_15]
MEYITGIPFAAAAANSVLELSLETMVLLALLGVFLVYALYGGKTRAISLPLSILLTSLLWIVVPASDTLDALGNSAKEAFWYQSVFFIIITLVLHWRLNRLIFIEYPDGLFRKGIEALLLSTISVGALIIAGLMLFAGDYIPLSDTMTPFFITEMALSAWSAAFFAILLLVSV